MQSVNCPLTSVLRLLLMMNGTSNACCGIWFGNPVCSKVIGCKLDALGTPHDSVLAMTDADWERDVKDRRRYSGTAAWVRSSVEDTWYTVYASSKKQNMVCLSSGESELMALVGGACEGIATPNQWSNLCNCSAGTIVPCTDSSAALGFVRRKTGQPTYKTRAHKILLHASLGNGT